MKTIQNSALDKLISAGKVIAQDKLGPKVVLLAPDRYLKIFHHPNVIATTMGRSHAKRFAKNAARLKQRGITTVGILDSFKTKEPSRDCVCYHGIPGDTLRRAFTQNPQDPTLSRQLGRYLAELHNAGVMFHSLSVDNIIRLADGSMGLIDITNLRVGIFTLSRSQRKRNFQHLFRTQKDHETIDVRQFEAGYLEEITPSKHSFYQQAIRRVQPVV